MTVDTKPLRKILELEHQKGYLNSAVIGGLDKFLQKWVAQAKGSITNPRLLAQFHQLRLTGSGYASLTEAQRKEWVGEALAFLAEIECTEREIEDVGLPQPPTRPATKQKCKKRRALNPLTCQLQ